MKNPREENLSLPSALTIAFGLIGVHFAHPFEKIARVRLGNVRRFRSAAFAFLRTPRRGTDRFLRPIRHGWTLILFRKSASGHAGTCQVSGNVTFHNVMLRFLPAACALLCASALLAQDETSANAGSSPAPGTDDVRVLRQLIEQQSRQIETLTQQVSKLDQLLEARSGTATAAATPAVTQNMPPVQESVASATPATEPPKAVAATPGADGGMTHVVAKGETLTVIAKHYKVSIADLLKVNKITDERKLQIGQTLTIPANAKPSDTSHP